VGVSEYKLTESLPKQLRGSLPSIKDLEAELKQPHGDIKSNSHELKRKNSNEGTARRDEVC
ncbi:MAG: hypothetical protein M1378_11030, partial [Bacteroidetes bacterium]|nr:hypothetical protein [Bacteroidota bacterium]